MELLTPRGIAGVAVVRAVCADVKRLTAVLCTEAGAVMPLQPGAPPRRATLRLQGRTIDDALIVHRGESCVELHVHGSRAVLDCLDSEFGLESPVPTPAWRLVQGALSVPQLQLGIEQVENDFDSWLTQIDRLPPELRECAVRDAVARSPAAMALATPLRVALVGRQNAGKSSLLNLVLGRERVVTGPTPGLTRDPVGECTSLAGYPYELIDTAGFGPTSCDLDAAASLLGAAVSAALRILVIDAERGPVDEDRRMTVDCPVVLATKSDLPAAPWPADLRCDLRIDSMRGDPAIVRRDLGAILRAHRGLPPAGRVGGVAALEPTQWALLKERARG